MRLRPLLPEHLPLTVAWRNEPGACVHLRTEGETTLEQQERWLAELDRPDARHRYWLAVSLAPGGERPVGYGGLTYISDGAAEIAWLLEPGNHQDRSVVRLLIAQAVEADLRLLYSEIKPECPVQRYLTLQATGFHGSPHRLVLSLD